VPVSLPAKLHCECKPLWKNVDVWATVSETVRPMLADRCLSCPVLSILSLTLVYCGQMVRLIKMPLGMEVDLGPGHIVLDVEPAPPKGHSPPSFWPVSIVAKLLDGSRCYLIRR